MTPPLTAQERQRIRDETADMLYAQAVSVARLCSLAFKDGQIRLWALHARQHRLLYRRWLKETGRKP